MSDRRSGRYWVAVYVLLGLVLVLAGGLAGAGTYGLLSDSQTDDAGTISVVKNNQAAVQWKGCKKADVTPDDPNDFDMIVELVDGRSHSYNQSDFTFSGDTFTYKTSDHWSGTPDMATITLDGTPYDSPQQCN